MSATAGSWPEPTLSVDDLALAMREGLEARKFFRSPVPATRGDRPHLGTPIAVDAWNILWPLIDVQAAPAPDTGRGPRGLLARRVRSIVKRMMDPWLARQTQYNRDLLGTLNHTLHEWHKTMSAMTHRLNELQADVTALPPVGAGPCPTLSARINECFHELGKLRRTADAGATLVAPPPAATAPRVIEALFTHTRLPTPPGRALVLAGDADTSVDLASLGFEVIATAAPAGPASHPGLKVVPARNGLPFAADTFDVVVALGRWPADGATAGEMARVCAPGGRLIGSCRQVPMEVAGMIAPFALTELCYATRAWGGWQLGPTPPAADAEVVALWVGTKA
jgi:SAM-dependent methyltransferase